MRIIEKKRDYKSVLLLSTALTAAVFFCNISDGYAAVCSADTNGADCTVNSGSFVSVTSIDAGNVNNSSSQWGTLTITGGESSFGGDVYLKELRSGYPVIFAEDKTIRVGNFTSNGINVNGVQRGNLYLVGSGTNYFSGESYLQYISSRGSFSLSDYLSVESIDAVNINNSQKGDLYITGTTSSSLSGNVNLSSLSSLNNTLLLSGAVQAESVKLNNVNSSTDQTGTLTITGNSNSSLKGDVYLSSIVSNNNTLFLTDTVQAESVDLNNINNEGNKTGSLIINGGQESSISGNVYLSSLISEGEKLSLAENSVINVDNIETNGINDSFSSNGIINVSQSAVLSGATYLSELNLAQGASVEFGPNFQTNIPLNLANASDVTVNSKMLVYQLTGMNGISDSQSYILKGGTWTGPSTWTAYGFEKEKTNVSDNQSRYGSLSYENGIYQDGTGGLFIEGNPSITFEGGVLWDFSAYASGFEKNAKVLLNNGTLVEGEAFSSNVDISNGIFDGKIDIRKGNPIDLVYTSDENGDSKSYNVLSSGNINVYGGDFYFSEDGSQIKTYASNVGDINIYGGQWFVGYQKDLSVVADQVMATVVNQSASGNVNISGGQFTIAQGNVLRLQGNGTGTISNTSSTFNIKGSGALEIDFSEFVIDSTLSWEKGTLRQLNGVLNINSQVTVHSFDLQRGSLVISGVLSIENDINVRGQLSGGGELVLSESASADFGTLVNFGTISLNRGTVSFNSGGSTLSTLNGSKGNPGGLIGTININAQTTIGTVNLGNSVLNLTEELIVSVLNFDNGRIVFLKEDKPLTLVASSTIWNTSQIVTDTNIVSGATPGILTIKDGMVLTFADQEGTTGHFESKNLTVNVENGAQAVFTAAETSFGSLIMTQGSASVKSGVLNVDTGVLGDQTSSTGSLNVDAGAVSNFGMLTANKGSTLTINGTLNVENFTMNGSIEQWSTLTGTGTVKITDKATFQGRITDLQNLQVVGQSASDTATANFNGQTGYPDTIGTMEVVYGTVNLNTGSLTLDSLLLDNGKIFLNGENVVLALKQSPSEDSGITGENNSISGIGTLELLNDTSISFGGGAEGSIGYLGGLKIGTGTATITADTTLGSVKFSSSQGGTLQINSGATLQLSDENGNCSRSDNCRITTNAGNVVQGEGALKLIDGNGSVFGGQVNLGRLDFGEKVAGGTISFNYAGQSNLNTFTVNSGGANVIVNNGVLTVQNTFGNVNTNVYGTGTLFVNNATFKNESGQSLANLIVGSGTVNVGSAQIGNISFNSASEGVLNLSQNLTVTGNITVNAGNVIGGQNLILSGSGATGVFSSGLDGLTNLNLEKGATAYINQSTKVGTNGVGLVLKDNSKVVIASGVQLDVKNSTLGADSSSVITGDGTLDLAGMTVNSVLDHLNNLSTSSGVSTITSSSTIKNSVTVADGTTLNFAGGSIGNAAYVNGTLNITQDTLSPTVVFDENGGTLDINNGKTLTITKNITVNGNDVLKGTGTLFLDGNSSGIFAMNSAFGGTIKIGSGTAYIQTNASIGAIGFADNTGGILDIADNNILTVGTIVTDGMNKITGNGTLNLTGQGSSFKAPIDNLGTLMVSNGGTAEFYNNINIGTLAFSNGGEVNLISGMTMNVNSMTQSGTNGIVYGEGSFVAGSGNVAFSTGNKNLAAATIGTGVLNFVGDSKIGSLKYSSVEGTINIEDDVTVVIGSDFSGIGKLTGAESARLQLEGQASATFDKANEYKGTISAGNGSLTFLSDTNFKSLILNSAYARFYRQSFIDEVLITDGFAEFDQVADVKSITISDKGAVYFKDTANLGALNIGAGTAIFEKNATLGNGSIASGGKLDIDVNTLTFNVGNFTFNDNSNFMMRISREATDEMGNVNATGYGKLVFNGGTLNIGNNVKLDITIDYGLQTAEGGSVFQLVEGSKTGFFVFENNRYDLKEETCSSGNGICYRLTQTSTGGQVAQEESGNQNQVNTAAAFLDGELFDYGTKAFEVAEHLDALSQKKGGHANYLKALTAVAPDVTGAMTRQPIALHSKVTNTVSARLNGLMGSMGSSSRTYREIQQMYGRSGGSPYNSRFMRAQDYYRRAGYYDQDDQPTPRPRPAYRRRVDPDSQEAVETTAERKRWAKRRTSYTQPKNFGLWAQAFYNTADYMSVSKPEGFSGDTTGIAIGADMQLFDVFAVGIGYASTTTSLDSLQRSTDISGDSFFLYGMYKPSDWFVSSVLNITSMTYDETKDLSGLTLSDSYDGSSFGASIMFGKDLKTWTPAVGLRYVSAGRDAHKDEVGQDISSVSTSALTFVAEGRFSRDFAKTDNSLWHSEFSAALTYDFQASGEDAVVNLPNGSSYTVVGDDFDPLGVELGASIAYLLGEHVDISAGYNLEWRPDYMSHSLTAMFRYSF